jgi:hypothetical protein
LIVNNAECFNKRVDSDAAFKWFLRELNVSLRLFKFKRKGQSFAREFSDSWQVINVQLSAFSQSGEKSLTLNFAVCSKANLRFQDKETSKPPLHYTCPMRFRIGWLIEGKDVWWPIRDESSAQVALSETLAAINAKGIPFLDAVTSGNQILHLYHTGKVLGFEIDRDEERLILLAETGAGQQTQERLREYEARWPATGAAERSSRFLSHFKETYRTAIVCADW